MHFLILDDELFSLNLSIIFFKLSMLLQLNTAAYSHVSHLVNTGSGGNETLGNISLYTWTWYGAFLILLTNLFTFGNVSLTFFAILLNIWARHVTWIKFGQFFRKVRIWRTCILYHGIFAATKARHKSLLKSFEFSLFGVASKKNNCFDEVFKLRFKPFLWTVVFICWVTCDFLVHGIFLSQTWQKIVVPSVVKIVCWLLYDEIHWANKAF